MSRKLILYTLMVLGFSITTLQFAATPLPTDRQALPVAHLEQAHNNLPLDTVVVRGFDISLPLGMDALDQRAEVMFDR
jgi:hypothetical protein